MEFIINSPKYGKFVVEIDDEDAEKVHRYRWHIIMNSYNNKQLHGVVTNTPREGGRATTLYLHTCLTGFSLCDHIDGNVLNNKRVNLREATKAENCQNQNKHSNNTSGYKGVYWDKNKKRWAAMIMYNSKRKMLGRHKTKEAAARAYNEAAKKYHGEFARLNEV